MMAKLNEFICPTCGHRWFEDSAYGTCDACQTFFYLSQIIPRITSTVNLFINGKPSAQWHEEYNLGRMAQAGNDE